MSSAENSPDRRTLLEALARGEASVEEVEAALKRHHVQDGIEDLGFANLDHDRAGRRGFPEVIFGLRKTPAQISTIFGRLAQRQPNVLATRVEPEAAEAVRTQHPELDAEYFEESKVLRLWRQREVLGQGKVLIVSGGTTDAPVAREAQLCADIMGNETELLLDVGVAGLHRLLRHVDALREAKVIIAAAGTEAALPSVTAGLVACPVVAVPTSVGYGASFDGLAALLGCLNACSAGVTTVNIDNGFGAAYAATLMNR